MPNSLGLHGLQPARLLCPWNSPGRSTGVGSYSLLQWIFLTQISDQGLLHCRQLLYCMSHRGSPGTGAPRAGKAARMSLCELRKVLPHCVSLTHLPLSKVFVVLQASLARRLL